MLKLIVPALALCLATPALAGGKYTPPSLPPLKPPVVVPPPQTVTPPPTSNTRINFNSKTVTSSSSSSARSSARATGGNSTVNVENYGGGYGRQARQVGAVAAGFSSANCAPYGIGAGFPGGSALFQAPDNHGACPDAQIAAMLAQFGCVNAAIAVLADVPRGQAIRDNPCGGYRVVRAKY